MGGLLNPEAYITATRQCIAQANSWSLEELMLDVTITDSVESMDECSFGVIGKRVIVIHFNIYVSIFVFFNRILHWQSFFLNQTQNVFFYEGIGNIYIGNILKNGE